MGCRMTNEVEAQYEAFPYPARDPGDEARRLITGSPSLPQEMDHYLWGGARDWSRPLRVLVAGGGTGDGLIQLCQMLTSAGRAYDAVYLDLSRAARAIAEERAKVRNLTNIRFETGSLLNASDFGMFDYIDCCGVLHHLPDPQAGFDAFAPPDGAFYIYADVSGHTDNALAFSKEMLAKAGVAATPGIDFDPSRGRQWMRFSYARATTDIAEGLARLKTFMEQR